jgi:ribonuclease inhibitor
MRVILDGSRVKSEDDLHRELVSLLDFGPYYGANLDALWDRLSTDVPRPVHLVWVASGISRDAMGSLLFDRVERILLNTAEQDITFNLADRFTYELG